MSRAETRAPGPGGAPNNVVPLIRLLRPRQWAKNILVFAAPGAAGVLDDPTQLTKTLVAFVAFCLAASGAYCLNDAADAEADRQHPKKRHRPVAAGEVSVTAARSLGITLLITAMLVSLLVGNAYLLATIVAYLAITTSYTVWLKHIAVIDLAAVASGFILRALAGAAATKVPLSDWFLIVASFGSLFIVAGKRSAEFAEADDSVAHRGVLAEYSPNFLTMVRSVSAAVTLMAYTLFAFEKAHLSTSSIPWFQLSIVPFALGVFRYALRLDRGEGGAPEDIILGDRTLQVLGLLFTILFAVGTYAS
jgi:decaprenyl-phosphate phosphoribosyltransferase